jgi:hypothetical protein
MTIPNITARTEVILDEIRLDVRELLQSVVGYDNTPALRELISTLITGYLLGFEEVQSAIVLCDETNNYEASELHADAMFVIDNISFRAACSVMPTIHSYNPDISVYVSIRRPLTNEPPRRVFYIDIGNATFNPDVFTNAFLKQAVDVEQELEEVVKLDFSNTTLFAEDYFTSCPSEGRGSLVETLPKAEQLTLDLDEYNIAFGTKSQAQVDQEFDAAVRAQHYNEMPSGLFNSLKV